MERFRSHLSLTLATIASLLLHAAVLLPWLHATLSGDAGASPISPASTPAIELEPPPPMEPQLGIEAETPSSLTWIGYEEYQEHLARLAEVEQAAFTQSEAGVPAPAPSPDATTRRPAETPPQPMTMMGPPIELIAEPVTEDTADATPPDAVAEADPPRENDEPMPPSPDPASEQSDEPMRAAAPAPPRLSLMPLTRVHDTAVPKPLDLDTEGVEGSSDAPPPTTDGEAARTTSEHADSGDDAGGADRAPANPAQQSAADPTERGQPDEPNERADESKPTPPPAPQGEKPGERSDRESDATSVIDAKPDNWKLGKPLAAPGIELRPQRPDFTLLQRLTLSPCSPLVEIRFGPDGKPREANVLESSRSESVDSAVKSSLYRWRASGDAISALAEDQTFRVVIRLVLNPYCP